MTTNDSPNPSEPAPASSLGPRWRRVLWRVFLQIRTFAAGITIGVLALSCAWISDSVLRFHGAHFRARTALREINVNLALALDRREDLSGRVSPSYQFTPKELEGYRRATHAELYDIDLRIGGMLRRGKDLVRTLGSVRGEETDGFLELCKRDVGTRGAAANRPCPVLHEHPRESLLGGALDAVVIPDSYSHSVFHIGSLGLIFFGYLAIGAGILSVLGALIGITFEMIKEFLGNALKASGASASALIAGVLGAGAVAAGVSAATVATLDKPDIGSGRPGANLSDTCQRTASCPGEPEGEDGTAPVEGLGSTGDQHIVNKAWHQYFSGDPAQSRGVEEAIGKLADAVRELNAKDPQVVRVPTEDPIIAEAITRLGRTVAHSIGEASEGNNERLQALMIELGHVTAEVKTVGVKQQQTIDEIKTSAMQTGAAVKAVNDTTAKLVPVASNTRCQNQWQEEVNSRNGFERMWNTLSGKGGNPCNPASTAATSASTSRSQVPGGR